MNRTARLFAAVSFTPAEKKALSDIAQTLRGHCAAARFPAPELLHVTLHFFGQTSLDSLAAIESAMRKAAASAKPFEMATGSAGTFGRGDSAVLWLGIDSGSEELKALQAGLETALAENGFSPEGRAFKAHITLARDVKFQGNPGEVILPAVDLNVAAITLMESTQARGRLEYVPLITVPFKRD